MIIILTIIFVLLLIGITIYLNKDIFLSIGVGFIAVLFALLIISIDFKIQTTATEVWSGHITNVEHKEEWNEWHPPTTYTTTDGKGHTQIHVRPGHWEHHDAENYIDTSDNGTISVDKSLNGIEFNDSYPNTNSQLQKYYYIGMPTASTHDYENRVLASYSIYNHKDIHLSEYKDLPEYPNNVINDIIINRLIGQVPNKKESQKRLAEVNSYLNKNVPDKEKPGNTRSWKEVNIILVNLKNKPIKYAYALQDKWKNGNKNDFIVAFNFSNNKFKWVYPFSWSTGEKNEKLKLEVKHYMLDIKNCHNFVPVINKISDLIANKFVRRQFKEFSYIQVDISTGAYIGIGILYLLTIITYIICCLKLK